jgi:hypothetical protein
MSKRKFVPGDSTSASSKFGQLIGEAFEGAVLRLIASYLEEAYPDYEILSPEEGKSIVTLEMPGGSLRQLDTVIAARQSDDPVALLETKWLKDARHHNDKGAWILQLREVKKRYATVRGAAAILAGYWTSGVGVFLMSESGVKMVWVASDEEVYGTLQPYVDKYLRNATFALDAKEMRQRYPRPADLANVASSMKESGELDLVAESWLQFNKLSEEGGVKTGKMLVMTAIDELLSPLPKKPRITGFQISLQVDTGNVIYQEFDDLEAAMDFIQTRFHDPDAILRHITPRFRTKS